MGCSYIFFTHRMEHSFNYIDEVLPGKSDLKIRVRINRMWTQPDRNNQHEIGTVEMILVDEKVTTC